MENNFRKNFGNIGEAKAEFFLVEKGFTIVEKNYRYRRSGEIDVIAKKDNLLIFVEVKNRKSSKYGGAHYSLNKKKIKSFKFVAQQFLNNNQRFNSKDVTCRFDMIAIENEKIEWIDDIFR